MAEQPVDLKFTADPSEAVDAAKKVQNETNKVGKEAEKNETIFGRLNGSMTKLAKRAGLAALAYIGLNKALSGINAIRDHVDEAEKLSRALEVSYEKAQELTIAEREAGLAAGAIRSAIEGIAQAQAQGMISADMQNLGFNLSEIADLKPDELFDSLSQRLKDGGLSARQFQAAVNVLGKDGADVALKLAGNFEHFRDVAKDSGQIISEEAFGKLINEADHFTAQITVIGEDILKAVTPFETFAEAASAALGFVNDKIEKLTAGIRYLVNFTGGMMGGLTADESAAFGATEAVSGAERARERARQVNESRSATENLAAERGAGAMVMLDYLTDRMNRGGQNISTLQRVGLAATGGESEAIRLQRRQLSKADSIDKQLVKQTNVLTDRL